MINDIVYIFLILVFQIDNPNHFNEYLVLAYGVLWVIGILYVANLINQQRNAQKDLELMRRLLEEHESDEI